MELELCQSLDYSWRHGRTLTSVSTAKLPGYTDCSKENPQNIARDSQCSFLQSSVNVSLIAKIFSIDTKLESSMSTYYEAHLD